MTRRLWGRIEPDVQRVATGIRLPAILHARLRHTARVRHTTMNALVIEACERFLADPDPEPPENVPLGT